MEFEDNDGIIIAQEFKDICAQILVNIGDRFNKEQIFTPCYVIDGK